MTLDEIDPTLPAPMPSGKAALSRRTLWVMSAACGVTVANTYYNQPLLNDFAKYF